MRTFERFYWLSEKFTAGIYACCITVIIKLEIGLFYCAIRCTVKWAKCQNVVRALFGDENTRGVSI